MMLPTGDNLGKIFTPTQINPNMPPIEPVEPQKVVVLPKEQKVVVLPKEQVLAPTPSPVSKPAPKQIPKEV